MPKIPRDQRPPADELRLVDRRELAELFGVSLTTVDKLRDSEPDFPKPIPISDRRLAWRVSTVAAWLAAREQTTAA
jgi:predicted DNA-binding transcriptional regulator AlpA